MGFIMHFYIIFGTNLLTEGPVQIVVFLPIQCSAEKEYQTESKWNETFERLGVDAKEAMRRPRGRRARPGGVGAPPPSWAPDTSPTYL